MPETTHLATIDELKELTTFFEPPSYSARASLLPGDFAKLMLVHTGTYAEPVWVEVFLVHNDQYAGALDEDPTSGGWERGDLVVFKPEHIIFCQHQDD